VAGHASVQQRHTQNGKHQSGVHASGPVRLEIPLLCSAKSTILSLTLFPALASEIQEAASHHVTSTFAGWQLDTSGVIELSWREKALKCVEVEVVNDTREVMSLSRSEAPALSASYPRARSEISICFAILMFRSGDWPGQSRCFSYLSQRCA